MRAEKFDLGTVTQVCLNAVNLLFLGYLIVYAVACPSPGLIGAVAVEIGFYTLVLGYRLWQSKQKKSSEKIQLEALHSEWKTLRQLRKTYRVSVIVHAGLVLGYLSVDLSALLAANFGNLDLAAAIYRAISPPASPSIHPGLSMELLAGGYVESKQFQKAEPIFLAIEKLRKSLVGEHDELIADIYANLGDLYAKEEQFGKAEGYYIRSIALAKELNLRQGYGSPMTKLGSLYAKVGRFEDADRALKDALAVRRKIFGAKSEKVRETLAAQVELLRLEGKTDQAELVDLTAAPEPKSYISSTLVPVSISVASAVVFWKRDKLMLVAANMVRSARGR